MTDGFYYDDDPPQVWLDDLHAMNIPSLWDIQLNSNQRMNLIARAKDELNEWRKRLRDDIGIIKSRFDHNNLTEMERVVVPYELLSSLGDDLNTQLKDLEQRTKKGRAVPEGFMFGDRIFGDMKSKRWHLGTRADEDRWDEFMSVESRYRAIGKEYQQQARVIKNAAQRIKEQQAENKRLKAEYDRRKSTLRIAIQVISMLLVAIGMGALGAFAFLNETSFIPNMSPTIFGGVLFVLAVCAVIAAIVLVRRRRTAIAQLATDITAGRQVVKRLTQAYNEQKRGFFPTQQTFKEVSAIYKELKASFETA